MCTEVERVGYCIPMYVVPAVYLQCTLSLIKLETIFTGNFWSDKNWAIQVRVTDAKNPLNE